MKENFPSVTSNKTEEQQRNRTAEKIVSFLEQTDTYEQIENIRERHADREHFDVFKDLLVRLNGIIRDTPIHKREPDGSGVEVSGFVDTYSPPRQEDKEALVKKAYEDSAFLNLAEQKYLLPAVINAVHLFLDGNGRTARIMYQLLEKHESQEEFLDQVRKALLKEGRYETTNVNPGLIAAELENVLLAKYGWTKERDHLGEFTAGVITMELPHIDANHPSYGLIKELSQVAGKNGVYVISALHSVLTPEKQHGIISEKDGRISLKKMADILNEQEWKALMNKYWSIKREYVDILIDVFVHPDEYKVVDVEKEITLKDLFIERIQAESKKI